MQTLKRGLLLLVLPIFAFTIAHKYYISVTNIGYSEKDAALQITTRIFIEDLETLLKERYEIEAHLSSENENPLAVEYIEKYFKAKFVIEINEEQNDYKFLGKKYDNDLVIYYLEISEIDISKVQSISIRNDVLTDLYDEQQNIVHFKLADKKKSYVLVKGNNKGMLKL